MTTPPTTATVRSDVLERLRPVTAAWSVNGRDVRFVTDFDHPVRSGGFVVLVTPDGVRYLAQVHELGTEATSGVQIDVDAAEMGLHSAVTGASVNLTARVVTGTGIVLARLGGGRLTGFNDAAIEIADDATIADYFDGVIGGAAGIEVGAVRGSDVAARLRATGFARHTFMCGQSGSGKTFSLGVVLERLLYETDLPLVIIDPNSDYVNLGKVTSRTAINRFRSEPMSRDEYDHLATTYPDRAGVIVASTRRNADLPLRFHLSDLTIGEQALTLQVDPIEDSDEYLALVESTNRLAGRSYDLVDLQDALRRRFDDASRRLAQRIVNLGVADWSVWARSDEPSIVGQAVGHRALILDTGSLADARERSVASLALLGRLRRRPQRTPISVVIDEAHNVCPPDARTPIEQAVTDLALWIAGEGRKYGIYLLLSTQRPQKIHRNVLSQCDNLLLMRVNSVGDLDDLAEVFSHVPAALIDEARSHQMGEMLAAGPVAPTPLRLQVGVRWTKEGGADLPTTWASPAG